MTYGALSNILIAVKESCKERRPMIQMTLSKMVEPVLETINKQLIQPIVEKLPTLVKMQVLMTKQEMMTPNK